MPSRRTVSLLIAGILVCAGGYYALTSLPTIVGQSMGSSTATSGPTSTVPENSIQITSATLNSSGYLVITVENTGIDHLVSLSTPYLTPPSGTNATGSWNPNPDPKDPVFPGETSTGNWAFDSRYNPGLQVEVSLRGYFLCPGAGLCHDTATFTLTVSGG